MNHANSRKDALHAGRMGVKYGGTQATPHASFIDPKYAHLILGAAPSVRMINGEEVQLKAGDTQQFFFGSSDPPPWYEPNAPKNDTPTGKTDREGRVIVK